MLLTSKGGRHLFFRRKTILVLFSFQPPYLFSALVNLSCRNEISDRPMDKLDCILSDLFAKFIGRQLFVIITTMQLPI